MIRVRTPGRLHFGLLPWAGGTSSETASAAEPRRLGGCGLMVSDPGLELRLSPAERWDIRGSLTTAVERALARLLEHPALAGAPPHRIEVQAAAPAHAGLGTGTQVSLGLALGLGQAVGIGVPLAELARWLGRGQRSRVGMLGFLEGGFIVDPGPDQAPFRLAFPEAWEVWIAVPREGSAWSGPKEAEAFARVQPDPAGRRELIHLLMGEVVPAVQGADFHRFGSALAEFNLRAGQMFAPAQGGRYADAGVERLVNLGTALGGSAGQSSWGPAVYLIRPKALALDSAALTHLQAEAEQRGYDWIRTTAQTSGAAVRQVQEAN